MAHSRESRQFSDQNRRHCYGVTRQWQSLMTSNYSRDANLIKSLFPAIISDGDNDMLLTSSSNDEITGIVNQQSSWKALGLLEQNLPQTRVRCGKCILFQIRGLCSKQIYQFYISYKQDIYKKQINIQIKGRGDEVSLPKVGAKGLGGFLLPFSSSFVD